MTHDLNDRCQHCKFWTGDPRDDSGVGGCRRYPPRPAGVVMAQHPIARQPQPMIIWGDAPEVKAIWWCGEFVVRQEIVQ